ncbi:MULTISPECIES: DUF1659 domain-containing protein [Bacillaceae]|uniref:DUF1659 domain-containing protein n=1 Tax=Bacillaceae TaxID=186817 RepID=UPI001E5648BB|nr:MULTISPECIES: DUF1659 domain-containing protein [Bacillaceae]MCE4047925.1 DUF1659 domain-containing protein [Bacillus sp. Au-Bac7]MCM3032457.1 DUF1659 domain-containing protein [Niallia sp. MER 6]MDL0436364.1 DUF1659 domain-containing protein [Niallia sp. SS-2023]UPO89236.1 DUF1659 domain-containing protein [Niallia sp. Man26]
MAQIVLKETSIKLHFQNGVKENGDPQLISKTFNLVKPTASADQILQAADSIETIVSFPVYSVTKHESYDISR